jgi:molecular chaperone HtpG
MGQLGEFSGTRFKDAARGELELGALAEAAGGKPGAGDTKGSRELLKRCKDALGEAVREVRPSTRLTDSPSCLVRDEASLSESMRRVLRAHGQEPPAGEAVLELNIAHALVRYLDGLPPGEAFDELARVLYDEARLAETGQVDRPAEFNRALNRVLSRLAGV